MGRDYLTRGAEHLPKDHTYRYVHRPEELQQAMRDIIGRAGEVRAPAVQAFEGIVGHEPYPVQDKVKEVAFPRASGRNYPVSDAVSRQSEPL